jgi:hypothetical protein
MENHRIGIVVPTGSKWAIALTLSAFAMSLPCVAAEVHSEYDALGRIVHDTNAQRQITDYAYDHSGKALPPRVGSKSSPAAIAGVATAATQANGVQGALPVTQIDFISDPGDYIGSGMTFSLTPAKGTISVTTLGASGIDINFNGTPPVSPWSFWTLDLKAVEGQSLSPGNYPSAQRLPFQSPKRPGLSIYGDGRGCNTLKGVFTVHEVVRDELGNITTFAADAEQHCEGGTAALRTRIRINSSIPMIVQTPQSIPGLPQEVYEHTLVTLDGSQSYEPAGQIVQWAWTQISGPPVVIASPSTPVMKFRAPEVAPGGADVQLQLDVADATGTHALGAVTVHVFDRRDRRTWLTWRSPPGDYIGGGVPLAFSLADGDATLSNLSSASLVDAEFQGGVFNAWSLYFAGADASALVPGLYVNAQRWPFQAAGHPGLSVYGSGRGCNTLSGQFNVLELNAAANPQQFFARFLQSCEASMPTLRGTIMFNGMAPGSPVAQVAGPASAQVGATVVLDGTNSTSTGSAIASFLWRQISGPPATMSDPTLATLQYTMPSPPGSSVRFELGVTDEDGLVDVAEIVTVATPAPPALTGASSRKSHGAGTFDLPL